MSAIVTRDGVEIFYKDWGSGQPIVFSHGWPLTSDVWEDQMMFLGAQGFRTVAYDRRGHGRSSQPWDGYDMDHYADDLADLLDAMDLQGVVLVGHATGGGEIVRYMSRYGTARVAKAVLVAGMPPLVLQGDGKTAGSPIGNIEKLRASMVADKSQFLRDFSALYFSADRPGAAISEGMRDSFWLQGMMGGLKAQIDCVAAFSQTDFVEDLKRIDVSVLLIHGDDDQIVPIQYSTKVCANLIPKATLKVYPGANHGLITTHKQQLNRDLLIFARP